MRAIHMSSAFWRAFLVAGLVLGGCVYGCGRTSLDDGFGPGDPTGSAGSTGTAGATGSGGQGIGPGSMVACGTGTCVAGMQSCCNRPDPTGHVGQACIDNSAPSGRPT